MYQTGTGGSSKPPEHPSAKYIDLLKEKELKEKAAHENHISIIFLAKAKLLYSIIKMNDSVLYQI